MPLIPFLSPQYPPAASRLVRSPARRRYRCMGRPVWRARFYVLGALLLCDTAWATLPDALPVNAQVREGGVAITRDAHGMQILQTGEHAIIDWRSFDVGRSVSLRVLQPSAGAALLNRVLGDTASDIAGELSANGQVHLVNPNGIRISPGGAVSAAGFVAATLDITNADFTEGNLRFGSLMQPSAGTVVHAGRITTPPGGFVALLGHRIEQSGAILTSVGQVGLGAGAAMKLTPGRDRFLEVTLAGGAVDDADQATPAITLSGGIAGDGSLVQICAPMAAVRGQAPAEAVNLSGIVQARHGFSRTGTILVDGDGGIVRLSGRLDASSNEMRGPRRPGGTVEVSGLQVMMDDEGIDVSGAQGGGRVRLTARDAGIGDGSRTLLADGVGDPVVFVGAWARINASATYQGNAGDVMLVSDGRVVFLGHGQARAATAADIPGPMQVRVVADTALPHITPPQPVRMPAMVSRTMQAAASAAAPRHASLPLPLLGSPGASSSGYSAGYSAGSSAGSSAEEAAGSSVRASAIALFAATPDLSVLPALRWTPVPDASVAPPALSRAPFPDVPPPPTLPAAGQTPWPAASRSRGLSIDVPVVPAPWAIPAMRRTSSSGLHDL
ncbi:MAG: filamentous hemagglutinin N-terminal domain-containing protein [Janthinobacterium lividum]